MISTQAVAGISLLLVCALPACAQQADDVAIRVTGSRTSESAMVTARVEAKAVRRTLPATLLEALNQVAGVRAVSTGGVGGGSFVSIRGGEPNFTLVLLDGIRVNDSTNSKGGAFDFTLIDPAIVDRIEIGASAASAVQGSDALSGVISIRLIEPATSDTHGSLRLQHDTLGAVGGSAMLSRGWKDGGLLVAGSAFDSNDADPGSQLRRWQGLLRARQRLGDYDAVALGIHAHNRHNGFPEDSGGPLLAVLRERERGSGDLWSGALALRHRAEGVVRPSLTLSYSAQASDSDSPAIAPGVLSAVPAIVAHNRLKRFEVIGDLAVHHGPLVFVLGAALADERGRSRGTIDFGMPAPTDFRLDRTTLSGFAEATLTPLPDLELNAALRHDAVKRGPAVWTGRASVSYRFGSRGPWLYGRVGQGFKLPSFFALGHPLVGNPALRSERSRNIEAGVQWRRSAFQGHLAWFDNRFTDLIDFDPTLFRNVNRAHVGAHGIEASLSWLPVDSLDLSGALTWLDLDSATPLRSRPRWQGGLRAAWQARDGLELGAAARFNSSFNDASVPTGLVRTAGHAAFDASLSYRINPTLKFEAALRNIGNARSGEAVGFPALGRSLRVAVTAGF